MKAGTILKLSASNYVGTHAPHLRKGITETLSGILSAAETFNTELAANAIDKNLSSQGRATRGKRVAAAALAKLNAVEATTIKNLHDRATSIENALLGKVTFTPPKDPAERMSHELQMQEIRSQLRELPSLERLNVLCVSGCFNRPQHVAISLCDLRYHERLESVGKVWAPVRSRGEQRLKRGHRLPPPIVPKDELVQVDLELGATDPVVSAYEPLLQVTDGAIGRGTTDLAPRRNSVRSGCVRGTCWKPISCRPLKLLRPSV